MADLKYRSEDIDLLLINVAANLLNQNLAHIARQTLICSSTIKRYRDLEVKRPSAHVLFVLADYYGIKVKFTGLIKGLKEREARLRVVQAIGRPSRGTKKARATA
jgi:hypothetical protein